MAAITTDGLVFQQFCFFGHKNLYVVALEGHIGKHLVLETQDFIAYSQRPRICLLEKACYRSLLFDKRWHHE